MEGLSPQAWHAGLHGRSFTVLNWLAAPSNSSSFWTSTLPICRILHSSALAFQVAKVTKPVFHRSAVWRSYQNRAVRFEGTW